MKGLPIVGAELALLYPARNRLNVPLEFVERRLKVLAARDCSTVPLDPETFLKQPLVRRGSILVLALDLDIDQERTLWIDAAKGDELPGYRLGVYDPRQPNDLIDWVGRTFGPTERERLLMQDAICRFKKLVGNRTGGLKIGAFPVEA